MDFIFNKQIPNSNSNELIFPPLGKTFITGLSYSYRFYYDPNFIGPYMKEAQFNYLMNSLNDELYSYWPCCICFYFGYTMSLCTLGLSFLCPNFCVSSAKKTFLEKLEYYNNEHFNPKGLNLTYYQKCSTSWLSFKILSTTETLSQKNKKDQKDKQLITIESSIYDQSSKVETENNESKIKKDSF